MRGSQHGTKQRRRPQCWPRRRRKRLLRAGAPPCRARDPVVRCKAQHTSGVVAAAAAPQPAPRAPRLAKAACEPVSAAAVAAAGAPLLARPSRGSAAAVSAGAVAPHRARLTGVHATVIAPPCRERPTGASVSWGQLGGRSTQWRARKNSRRDIGNTGRQGGF